MSPLPLIVDGALLEFATLDACGSGESSARSRAARMPRKPSGAGDRSEHAAGLCHQAGEHARDIDSDRMT